MPNAITVNDRRTRKLTRRENLVARYAKLPGLLRFLVNAVPTAAIASFPMVYASGILSKGMLWPSFFFVFVFGVAAVRSLFSTTRLGLVSIYANRISASLDALIVAFARHRHVSSDTIKDILHTMNLSVRTLTGISESDSILVGIMTPATDGSELVLRERTGTLGNKHKERVSLESDRASAVAYRDRRVVIFPDTRGEKAYNEEEELDSVVAIPLIVPHQRNPLGVLVLAADTPNVFSKHFVHHVNADLRPYEKLVTLCLLTGAEP